nr:immunoglobulin heavy chain junction region [Macaca mulatta]MOW24967.1 immunoglobulin heavy chain junction region [Macaca mulatta]
CAKDRIGYSSHYYYGLDSW